MTHHLYASKTEAKAIISSALLFDFRVMIIIEIALYTGLNQLKDYYFCVIIYIIIVIVCGTQLNHVLMT